MTTPDPTPGPEREFAVEIPADTRPVGIGGFSSDQQAAAHAFIMSDDIVQNCIWATDQMVRMHKPDTTYEIATFRHRSDGTMGVFLVSRLMKGLTIPMSPEWLADFEDIDVISICSMGLAADIAPGTDLGVIGIESFVPSIYTYVCDVAEDGTVTSRAACAAVGGTFYAAQGPGIEAPAGFHVAVKALAAIANVPAARASIIVASAEDAYRMDADPNFHVPFGTADNPTLAVPDFINFPYDEENPPS